MGGKFIQVYCKGLRQLIHMDCIMNIQETFEGGCILFLKDGKGKLMTCCPDDTYDFLLRQVDFAVVRKNNVE